jgi:hypothetical protein
MSFAVPIMLIATLLLRSNSDDVISRRLSLAGAFLCVVLGFFMCVLAWRQEPRLVLYEDAFEYITWSSAVKIAWKECVDLRLERFLWFDVVHYFKRDTGTEQALFLLLNAPGAEVLSNMIALAESAEARSDGQVV